MTWNWFEVIQYFYSEGLWTIEQVRVAVEMGAITPEEYKIITGEDYVA